MPQTFDAQGFDQLAQAIRQERKEKVVSFLSNVCGVAPVELENITADQKQTLLTTLFVLEDDAFRELGHTLQIEDRILFAKIQDRWQVGVFTPMHPRAILLGAARPAQPALDDIVKQITSIYSSVPQRIWPMHFKSICWDDESSEQLAKDLEHIPHLVAQQLRSMINQWLQGDELSLLEGSSYPYLAVLQYLALYEPSIKTILEKEQATALTAGLRADLIALQQALSDPQLNDRLKVLKQVPFCCWDESLLHQPIDAVQRARYQNRIVPLLREDILELLVSAHECDKAHAIELYTAYCTTGLEGIIALRCSTEQARHICTHQETQRINDIIEPQLKALPEPVREQTRERIKYLQSVNIETGHHVPIVRLLRGHPGNAERRRRSRKKPPPEMIKHFARKISVSPKLSSAALLEYWSGATALWHKTP